MASLTRTLAAIGLSGSVLASSLPQRGLAAGGHPVQSQVLEYPKRHALIIGIREYTDPSLPKLPCAAEDAKGVAETLIQQLGFDPNDVRLLLDKEATRDAIEEAIKDWAGDRKRIGENDLFVFMFAGHGLTRDAGGKPRGMLAPVDAKTNSPTEPIWSGFVPMSDLEQASEYIPAKHALFILDCCFGGLAVTRSGPVSLAGMANRARQILTAGNAEQSVLDGGGNGHSVFTAALIDAIRGQADLDGDEVVNFGELYNYVGRRVESETQQFQTPLQATFPDHKGGSVALYPRGARLEQRSPEDRLGSLQKSSEEQFEELKAFSDLSLVRRLEQDAEGLWPMVPGTIPGIRAWLGRAMEPLARQPQHEQRLKSVRQEAYLEQLMAGVVKEGGSTEPDWDKVDPLVRWRFESLQQLVGELRDLGRSKVAVESRLRGAETIHDSTLVAARNMWTAAITEIGSLPQYHGLALEPQLGLIPLRRDPQSGLWEFWHVQSGKAPILDPSTNEWKIEQETGIVLVLLPGGSFSMGSRPPSAADPVGSPNVDPFHCPDEGPVRKVDIPAFFLSKYESTVGQIASVLSPRQQPAETRAGVRHPPSMPATDKSWTQFSEIASHLDLRLPTEEEWEYGCRAGTTTVFATGDSLESLAGYVNPAWGLQAFPERRYWICGNSFDAPLVVLQEVGTLLPNRFGLHEILGNVWEWCQGDTAPHPNVAWIVPEEEGKSGLNPNSPRPIRGGNFNLVTTQVEPRSAFRLFESASFHSQSVGFRSARSITRSP